MQEYQVKYIENTRKIAELSVFYNVSGLGFDDWVAEKRSSEVLMEKLREENNDLLGSCLFPVLDGLHSASSDTIEELSEFASALMDRKTNLDCGIYIVIHEAILRYYRVKKDRNSMIKELYMLGMGLYYLRRSLEGIDSDENKKYAFRNEMLFTEASSYLRYFDGIDDEETRGYIIRSLHNISLSVKDVKRRIAVNARSMSVIKDEYYRQLAPGLPWDAFERASHQQMSINRNGLSDEDITKDEIATVLDSCYEVFKPEAASQQSNVRWLWPYYSMEYSCGYVDLKTTVDRMEKLIDSFPYDQYDVSGLYSNVQLAIDYGRLIKDNPQLQLDEERIRFLDKANRKMLKVLLTCPPDKFDDHFFYTVDVAISNLYEVEGSLTYRELSERILRRFSGSLYLKARKTGKLMRCIARSIMESEFGFFDDIPFISAEKDSEKKKQLVLGFAEECGLLSDFGLVKMNMMRLLKTRNLTETEDEIFRVHTLSGAGDLGGRRSTEAFADTALGHHSWYNGEGGYPSEYNRLGSPYRQMTDIAAVASFMISEYDGSIGDLSGKLQSSPRGRFSPIVLSELAGKELLNEIDLILGGDDTQYYREIFDELTADKDA